MTTNQSMVGGGKAARDAAAAKEAGQGRGGLEGRRPRARRPWWRMTQGAAEGNRTDARGLGHASGRAVVDGTEGMRLFFGLVEKLAPDSWVG